jgi:hypothetical protein
MKSLTVFFVALVGIALAGCGSFSVMHPPWNKCVAHCRINPPELDAFLDAATDAAKDIALADTISDWQFRYDKVKDLNEKLPETLGTAARKECDGIMEQMEIGKLALTMKRVDAKSGLKQCKLVSADITKHINKIRTIADSPANV